jgi:hypothetical protein
MPLANKTMKYILQDPYSGHYLADSHGHSANDSTDAMVVDEGQLKETLDLYDDLEAIPQDHWEQHGC